ncbi:hypothetical protein J6I39_06695 [bacterium]|nr:hypothetical protein [bacterium]
MEIRTTYIGINENGIKGIWCGFKPEKAIIEEARTILYPDENKILRHKETQIEFTSVWLQDDMTEEDYEEIERNTPNDIINENMPALDGGEL